MSSPGRRIPLCLFAAAVAVLALPATAPAKMSCDERGPRGGVVLDGLPARPVAKRTYTVEAFVPGGNRDVIHGQPALGRFRCSGAGARDAAVAHWMQPLARPGLEAGSGRYAYALRFPRPGEWALAVFDRRGRYRDLGRWRVTAPPPPAAATDGASISGDGVGGLAARSLVAGAIALVACGAAVGRARSRGRSWC